jgi:hypothetical protein
MVFGRGPMIGNPKTRQAISSWLFALSVVGYPIVGLLVAAMDWPSRWMSAPFRAGVAILAATLITLNWRKLPRTTWTWLLLAWLALYALRLIGNVSEGHLGTKDELLFFVLTVALPVMALADAAIRDTDIAAPLACLAGAAVIFALIGESLGVFGAHSLTFTSQLQFSTLNAITLGHTAVILLISAVALPLKGAEPSRLALLVVLVMLALATLGMTNARGPFVALVVVLTMMLASTPAAGKTLLNGRPAIACILAAATLLFLQPPPITYFAENSVRAWVMANPEAVPPKSMHDEIVQTRRNRALLVDRAAVARKPLLERSWIAFMDNPITGASNWEANGGKYPHNSILEAFQNLGVFGGAAFVCLLVVGFRRAWDTMRSGEMLVPLLYVQAFVASQFSGSLYASAQLFITLALLLGTTRDQILLPSGTRSSAGG